LIFARETLTKEILDEAFPLLKDHWKEIAHYQDILLEPDTDLYLKLVELGLVRLFTVRDEDKNLFGYSVFMVRPNLHYKSSLQANNDVIYLDPSIRGGMNGYRFIKWCDEELKKEGIQIVTHHVKKAHNFGSMLERLNYELVDLIYCRRLN
jgi:hypothetical protein